MQVPAACATVAELLVHFGLDRKIAVVEHNLRILQKNDYSGVQLAAGDRIEIVHFVGGG